jgi:hypothetical protein
MHIPGKKLKYLYSFLANEASSKLEDVLVFITGASVPPPKDFETTPTIEFHDGNLPRANTCSTTLNLPIVYKEYEVFKGKMDLAILNSSSFGQA